MEAPVVEKAASPVANGDKAVDEVEESVKVEAADDNLVLKAVAVLEAERQGLAAEEGNKTTDDGLVLKTEPVSEAEVPLQTNGEGGTVKEESSYYKTTLCVYFRKGSCRSPGACRYAHGEEELRQRPDGTWDPSSERAKTLKSKPVLKASHGGGGGSETEVKLCLLNCPFKWQSKEVSSLLQSLGLTCQAVKKRRATPNAFLTFHSKESADAAEQALEGHLLDGEGSRQLHVAPALPRQWERLGSEEAGEDAGISDNSDGGEDSEQKERQGQKEEKEPPPAREIWEAVTPLAKMPYLEQLERKKAEIAHVLKTMVRKTRKCCPRGQPLPEWVATARDRGNLACEYLGVMPSPQETGYRNKCEFSMGMSAEGHRTVGFQLGMFREGVTAVAEPVNCKNISSVAVQYAALMQDFIRTSPLAVWDKKLNKGFWRMLTVREGRPPKAVQEETVSFSIAEVMLVVQVNPEGVSSDDVEKELERMALALAHGARTASPPLPLTVLLLQEHTGVSNSAPANCPLRKILLPAIPGSEETSVRDESMAMCIHEHLGGLKFRISSTAFFQVNTLAAERLYELAGDWAGIGPDTLLFDVCCGTGTIGLTLAHRVAKVVGIEMNEFAVEDARINAKLNGITNCDFVAAKAEDVMERLLDEYSVENSAENSAKDEKLEPLEKRPRTSNLEGVAISSPPVTDEPKPESGPRKYSSIVAIVDPPRSGLHPTVVRTLRAHARLRRLVYVSCNAATLASNALELCTPLQQTATELQPGRKRGRGGGGEHSIATTKQRLQGMAFTPPFCPVKAMAVDMFPHTAHCEVVVLFER